VLQHPWWGRSTNFEPQRNLRPRVAARSKWSRIEALLRDRAFLVDYAAARAGWQEGATVMFPTGTYWLRRFANVHSGVDPRLRVGTQGPSGSIAAASRKDLSRYVASWSVAGSSACALVTSVAMQPRLGSPRA